MHRIDTTGAVGGAFVDGDPATATPATILGADFMNDLQETVAYPIEQAGITLVKGSYTQLLSAMEVLTLTGTSHDSRDHSVALGSAILADLGDMTQDIASGLTNATSPTGANPYLTVSAHAGATHLAYTGTIGIETGGYSGNSSTQTVNFTATGKTFLFLMITSTTSSQSPQVFITGQTYGVMTTDGSTGSTVGLAAASNSGFDLTNNNGINTTGSAYKYIYVYRN